jgi:hypothetical protein
MGIARIRNTKRRFKRRLMDFADWEIKQYHELLAYSGYIRAMRFMPPNLHLTICEIH